MTDGMNKDEYRASDHPIHAWLPMPLKLHALFCRSMLSAANPDACAPKPGAVFDLTLAVIIGLCAFELRGPLLAPSFPFLFGLTTKEAYGPNLFQSHQSSATSLISQHFCLVSSRLMLLQMQHLRLMVVDLDGDTNAESVDPTACDFLGQCKDFTLHDLVSAPDGSLTLQMDTEAYGETRPPGTRVSSANRPIVLLPVKILCLWV